MANFDPKIVLSAEDRTKAAFDSLRRNLTNVQRESTVFSNFMRGLIPALTVGSMAAFAKSGIDAADALNDMSQRLGVSVKDLASFKLAAEQSGTSLEGVGKGIARLSRSIGDAEADDKKMAKALTDLGISARDPKEAFFQLADAVERIQDPSRRATLLNQVLGKSYQELIPLLAQGGDELRRLAAGSETFAEAMARLAPDADKFNDNLAELKQNAATAAAYGLAPLVEQLNEVIARFSTLARLRGAGASILEIVMGTATADTGASLKRYNKEISDLEAKQKRLGTVRMSAGDRNELDRLKAIRAELIAISVERIQKPIGGGEKSVPAIGGGVDLSAARAKTATAKKQPSIIDVFDNGSYITKSKEAAAMIREQQAAINDLNGEIAETAKLYDALGSGSFMADAESSAMIREQQAAINDLNNEMARSLEDSIPKLEKTRSLAEEIGLSFTSAFEDAIVAGGEFSDVLKGIADDILKFWARKMVTEPMMGAIGSMFGFANGGIMTASGPLPLKSYATGGIASTPQLALFGEGSTNEAFVPLPDGRSIPVMMKNGSASVQVNVINNASGTEARTSERADNNGNRIIDVMIDQVKSAMAGDVARGGTFSSAMERTYGLSRAAGAF